MPLFCWMRAMLCPAAMAWRAYFPSFNAKWVLWNGRVGDIAAMWLTISGVAIVAGIVLCLLWRHKERVGAFTGWMIVLVGSAVAAPMIGEIGQASAQSPTASARPT
jgi:hypothetical protein